MMPSIDGIYNTGEVLVIRVDAKSTIMEAIYYNQHFAGLMNKIMGKTFREIGLDHKNCEQCVAHLKKVFLTFKKETFQLHIKNRKYQIYYFRKNENILLSGCSQTPNLPDYSFM